MRMGEGSPGPPIGCPAVSNVEQLWSVRKQWSPLGLRDVRRLVEAYHRLYLPPAVSPRQCWNLLAQTMPEVVFGFVADDDAFNHVDDILGDICRMVGDSLDVP